MFLVFVDDMFSCRGPYGAGEASMVQYKLKVTRKGAAQIRRQQQQHQAGVKSDVYNCLVTAGSDRPSAVLFPNHWSQSTVGQLLNSIQ